MSEPLNLVSHITATLPPTEHYSSSAKQLAAADHLRHPRGQSEIPEVGRIFGGAPDARDTTGGVDDPSCQAPYGERSGSQNQDHMMIADTPAFERPALPTLVTTMSLEKIDDIREFLQPQLLSLGAVECIFANRVQ